MLDDGALAGKPVLIGATGGTARHSLALEHALRPLFAYLRAIVLPDRGVRGARGLGRGHAGIRRRPGARVARRGSPGSCPCAGSSRLPGAGLPDAGSPGSDGTGAPVGALADRITRAGRELAEQVALRERPPATDPFALSTSFERLLAGD